jgi:hypothetical protein
MRPSTSVFFFIVTLIALTSAGDTFDISRSGRKIQLDGFLMDWMEKNMQAWNGSTLWSWDAINTTDGVAGYFHAGSAPACSSWVFKVDAGRNGPSEMIASAAKDTETAIYCTNRTRQLNHSSITMEWLFPWDSVVIDGNGTYAINITGNSTCGGDSLESMLLTGKKPLKPSILPKNFTLKLILIILLFVVFFGMQARIRKKIRRRELPRQ